MNRGYVYLREAYSVLLHKSYTPVSCKYSNLTISLSITLILFIRFLHARGNIEALYGIFEMKGMDDDKENALENSAVFSCG